MTAPSTPTPAPSTSIRRAGDWLGINRATMAVLVVTAGLGLSEEIWRNFLAIHLKETTGAVLSAVRYMGVFAFLVNLLEGFGYIVGGALAHRMGPRVALGVSALPMAVGFSIMLWAPAPWLIVVGALLITNWEPLSVPATFEVVGSEVPRDRRAVAFAVQSIQKRLPKLVGPLVGGLVMAVGYWVNLALAFGILGVVVVLQATLLGRMTPRPEGEHVPLGEVLRRIPPELRTLLTAEILLRWGDWFVRDFAVLYVVGVLGLSPRAAGLLVALTHATALVTYIPMGKIIDRAPSPRPYIGLTFLLFALFPILLVALPASGLPLPVALAIVFALNGLREIGEPARKALISSSFPKEIRARGIGLYWGLRSLSFCVAPLVASALWARVGPQATFLIGGALGLGATAWFFARALRGSGPRK